MPKKDFEFKNLPLEAQDKDIKAEDFKFVDNKNRVHEQKFQTRPVTFLRDSLRRFAKNKSSVVASVILGILVLMAIFVPIVDPYEVSTDNSQYMTYLEPKLFDSGTGFWDGTKQWEKIPTKTFNDVTGEEFPDQKDWWPNPERFPVKSAISNKVFTEPTYTNGQSKYGKKGYIEFGYSSRTEEGENIYFRTLPFAQPIDLNETTINLKTFETFDLDKLLVEENNKPGVELPYGFEIGEVEMYLGYTVDDGNEKETKEIKILDGKKVFSIGSSEAAVNLTDNLRTALLAESNSQTKFEGAFIELKLVNEGERKNTCALIKSLEFDVTSTNPGLKAQIEEANFTDATECILRETKEKQYIDASKTEYVEVTSHKYWECNAIKQIHLSQVVYCSFKYDSYEASFGTYNEYSFSITKLEEYAEKGWIVWDDPIPVEVSPGVYEVIGEWRVLDEVNSPVKEFLEVKSLDGESLIVNVKLCHYRYYGYTSMPKFLMGTDRFGNVMFRYVFEGLLTSLCLGFGTFIICFLFGLLWGSISGYFGGTVDLIMERITDILSGIPWVVVMTLAIIKFRETVPSPNVLQEVGIFAFALCVTGWIGTAATTRTQFYRFRSREYVLASRTLGASDARLISKHILPNAMGTIITSAVLMIPSIIFSEATISYLHIGLQNLPSLGVILSNNQAELTSNPYLLIFPSVVIALLMISFNLFGNGLRDAVNPSLKGEE